MVVVADACISRKVVEALRDKGYDVLYICEVDSSMPDSQVMSIGYGLHAPIITHDHHFRDYDNPILLHSKKSVDKTVKEAVRYLEGYE